MSLLREFVRGLLRESEEDPLAAVISGNRRFILQEPPDPINLNDRVYYISSGARGVRYTLRVKYIEWAGGADGDRVVRDGHLSTLGKFPERSAKKAEEVADGSIYYQPTELSQRAKAVSRSIIKFGRHKGEDVYDVVSSDPGYMIWMYSSIVDDPTSFLQGKHYKTFRAEAIKAVEGNEALMAEVERKKSEYEEKKRGWEEQKKEREQAKISSEYVGKIGKRQDFVLTLKGKYGFETRYGWTNIYNFRDENGNTVTWFTSSYINIPSEEFSGQIRPLEKDETIKAKATVKDHKVYKDEKQTVVTRLKFLGLDT